MTVIHNSRMAVNTWEYCISHIQPHYCHLQGSDCIRTVRNTNLTCGFSKQIRAESYWTGPGRKRRERYRQRKKTEKATEWEKKVKGGGPRLPVKELAMIRGTSPQRRLAPFRVILERCLHAITAWLFTTFHLHTF